MMNLVELLRARRTTIVEGWLHRIARSHDAGDLPTAELRDHLPGFFDELLEALEHHAEPQQAESTAAASRHGEQRLRVGFDVDEVVLEYDFLGDTILREARAASIVFTIEEAQILLRLINAGTREAVAAYVRRRDEQARREAEDHVSFVAHELRNALSTATLAMTGLRRTLLSAGGGLVEMLDRGISQMRELVDKVLVAARFPHVELQRERVVIRDVVAEAVHEVAPKAEHKGIRVTLDFDEDLQVVGDRRLLHSVVTNLIGNAIKFTTFGGTVVIRGRRDDDHAVLDFEDGCGGLPPGSPEDLFQPYVQRGRDRSGLGLGLAIVKQAVSAHAGTVEIENRPGIGCRFRVRLATTERSA
jgi:signal transduction histidine kinase